MTAFRRQSLFIKEDFFVNMPVVISVYPTLYRFSLFVSLPEIDSAGSQGIPGQKFGQTLLIVPESIKYRIAVSVFFNF